MKVKTGGQEGDPLEILMFNLTTLHRSTGTYTCKVPADPSACYADDGYIKSNMSVTLQVLTNLKCVLKEDDGLDLHVVKTSVLPKVDPNRLSLMWHRTSFRIPPH